MKLPTAADVRAYRDAYQCSMGEARNALFRATLIQVVDEATTVEDLKALLKQLINRNYS